MSLAKLLWRSLVYYRRIGVVVVFGLAVASAVITGSLVIGDSVHGSLRDTALSRLGRTDRALVAPRHFRAALAGDLLKEPSVAGAVERICPVLISQGAARHAETNAIIPDVSVVGVDEEFWGFYELSQRPRLSGRECAVNAALARDLGLAGGDYLLVTVQRKSAVASSTLFARRGRQDTAPSLRVKVSAILPEGGAGDFRLDAQSAAPRNVFMSRAWLAERLGKQGEANTLLVASKPEAQDEVAEALREGLAAACTLADYGLKLTPNTQQNYVSLTSEATLLTDAQIGAGRAAAKAIHAERAITSVYLATSIKVAGAQASKELAYAVIAGTEAMTSWARGPDLKDNWVEGVAPELVLSGELRGDELWLNSWAARDLGANLGDMLEVSYLVPTADGTYPTARVRLRLKGALKLASIAADPGLVPDFEGITDAESIDDWDPPFPIDLSRITERDEEYWDKHRATPKAFVSLETMRAMWQSAPGGAGADWVTSLRIDCRSGVSLPELHEAFRAALLQRLSPGKAGLAFRPVRRQALEASRGTSDFGQLFLGLSMFLVFSGAGLAGMLLRLSVDRRASESGIMLACGIEAGLVGRVLLIEGGALTVLGTLLGVPGGVLYAAGMIAALGKWWGGALGATSSLWLHVTPGSLAVGAVSGLAIGLLTVAWSTRRLARLPVLALLAGSQAMAVSPIRRGGRLPAAALVGSLVVAAGLGVLATRAEVVESSVAFFGIGACLLLAGLAASSLILSHVTRRRGATRSLLRLSGRNAAASGGRSLLVIGLLAAATFVIVAVAANTRGVSGLDYTRKNSGAGGFALRATSSVPLQYDLGAPAGRENLGFSPEDEKLFEGVEIVSFLASPGEDISCLNIARPTYPRVLGVPDALIERGGFSVITRRKEVPGFHWVVLKQSPSKGVIPAFGNADSVRWTLHSGLGEDYTMPGADGRPVKLRFLGLLAGSIFAREILVSEERFRKLFASVTAPSYFLIATPPGREEQVAEALRRNLGEMGLEVRTTREVLNEFMRVQNTYLAMFLALGGLGLLLGTVGLAAVLLRSALERRGELALMLATGFSRMRVAGVLLLENVGLLLAGLSCGVASALVAVAPQLAAAESSVNWLALASVLGVILVVGVTTCLAAVRSAVRGRLIEGLREE